MTKQKPKFDRSDLYVLLVIGSVASLVVLGIAIEILKFAALVKWVFS